MEEFKGRDVASVSDSAYKKGLQKVFIKDGRSRRRLFFIRAFEHHFGPREREFERSNLQKFKCPACALGGTGRRGMGSGEAGWVGMLKFRVDRRIICISLEGIDTTFFHRAIWLKTV